MLKTLSGHYSQCQSNQ